MSLWSKTIRPFLAFLLALLVTCATVVVVFTKPYLTSSGEFSSAKHSIYIIILSATSTIISSFLSGQLRRLFLRRIDSSLNNYVGSQKEALVSTSNFEALDNRWQTILGLASFLKKLRQPRIGIVYLFTGFVTTVLISAFQQSVTVREYPFSPVVPYGPNRCVKGELSSQPPDENYWWPTPDSPLGNASGFFIQANLDDCPTGDGSTLVGSVNTYNPSVFAYADKGVAIHPTAVGAPVTVYSSEGSSGPLNVGFGELMNLYGSNIVNTSQCIPVMVKNPISCHKGGSVVVDSDDSATAYADDGMCVCKSHFSSNPAEPDNPAMSDCMCPHGNVGQGTIVFGAFWLYAQLLALTIGDIFVPGNNLNDGNYTVTCSLDTTDVFEYRMVTLSLQSSKIITQSGYAKSLVGAEPCIPSTDTIDIVKIATAAAGNWHLLKEGQYHDGLFTSLLHMSVVNTTALIPRQPPWAFNNSKNALEDVMGLAAALVVSRVNSSTVGLSGMSIVTAMRIGTGNLYALALAIPPAAVTIFLAVLFLKAPPWSKVDSSSLADLIKFGKNLESWAAEEVEDHEFKD